MFKASTSAIRPLLGGFLRDECGTTAIEYALIASGVSIAIAAAVVAVGSSVQGMFSSIASALK
jgi:pilus assembly protein Flp/PilA